MSESPSYLVEILLPRETGHGRPIGEDWFDGFLKDLTEKFGGATSFLRTPGRGLWQSGGTTEKDGLGPHRKPAVAWIRTRIEEATLLIGGRHLGAPDDPAVRISISVNGTPQQTFEVRPGFFFRLAALPAGSLAGGAGYIPLEVKSEAADGSNRVIPVDLEQFNLQSPGKPMIGLEEGWQEPEYDPRTARSWRWAASMYSRASTTRARRESRASSKSGSKSPR